MDFHKLDTDFHLIIFNGNKKENVWEAIRRLGTHYNRIRILSEIENGFGKLLPSINKLLLLLKINK